MVLKERRSVTERSLLPPGSVSQEVLDFAQEAGYNREEVKELFEKSDLNQDNKISFEE